MNILENVLIRDWFPRGIILSRLQIDSINNQVQRSCLPVLVLQPYGAIVLAYGATASFLLLKGFLPPFFQRNEPIGRFHRV